MSKRYASAQYTRVYEDPEDRKRKEFENDDSLFAGIAPAAAKGGELPKMKAEAAERRKAAPLHRKHPHKGKGEGKAEGK